MKCIQLIDLIVALKRPFIIYGHNPRARLPEKWYNDWWGGTYCAYAWLIGANGEARRLHKSDNDDAKLRGSKAHENHALMSAHEVAKKEAVFFGCEVFRCEHRVVVPDDFAYPPHRGEKPKVGKSLEQITAQNQEDQAIGGPVGEEAFKEQFLVNPEWSIKEKFQAPWTDTGRYKK